MAIVSGLFVTLFTRLPALATRRSTARQRRLGAVAAMLALAAYTLLVGAGPAVVRAAVMSCLSLLAVQLGRRQDDVRNGLNNLLLVAAGMALLSPYLPWGRSVSRPWLCTTQGCWRWPGPGIPGGCRS